MATNKRVFTLRLSDEVFDKIGVLATKEHRSITNYIEYVLLKHLEEVEREQGKIDLDKIATHVFKLDDFQEAYQVCKSGVGRKIDLDKGE